ncbi:MAG: ABC transporter permease subunit [Deltaproteobacteria bacterium]|nr:ABC transporter permease subunit [Deltaproteobacteria bacterium]
MNAEWTSFLVDRLPELWLRVGQHLVLTGVSVAFAILIGVSLGILAGRVSWIRGPIVGAAGVLQTIPSLAMLTLLLALLQRIGAVPAILALTLYALLPIVRNTITGLGGVSREVVEAARGVGMSRWQELRLVRLPLALPVIVAGIRTAAVAGVGIATLSAFIGAGGLGQFINRGLALADTRLILLGAIPAALLALLVDFALGATNWALDPRRKTGSRTRTKMATRMAAIILPFLIFATGGFGYVRARPDITIGSKNFTEQIILGHMMALLIEDHTNLKVDRRFNLGGTMICHGALVHGEIDLYAEYTGTGLTAVLGQEPSADPDQVYKTVSREYRDRFDVQWLDPFGMNNTYSITVLQADAERYGWDKVSDLESWAKGLHAGFPGEFVERPDGYPGFQNAYRFEFGQVSDIDAGLMYDAIANGEVDVIAAFATDGRIAAYNLRPLVDDRRFFPPYHAAPVVRTTTLRQYPQVRDALEKIAGALDDRSMRKLNGWVDQERRSPESVAKAFLRSKGLLKGMQKR